MGGETHPKRIQLPAHISWADQVCDAAMWAFCWPAYAAVMAPPLRLTGPLLSFAGYAAHATKDRWRWSQRVRSSGRPHSRAQESRS